MKYITEEGKIKLFELIKDSKDLIKYDTLKDN